MTSKRLPKIIFSPMAWLKLQYFCHRGDTEVGGFGISAQDNSLYIEDFVTVRQDTSPVTVSLRDDAVADHFDRCVDLKLTPERFARIWLHTHPGASVQPSRTDEETFTRVFGGCDWAVMFILGRTGKTFARLSLSGPVKIELELTTTVDWAQWPAHAFEGPSLEYLLEQWADEYGSNINSAPRFDELMRDELRANGFDWIEDWDWLDEHLELTTESLGANDDVYAFTD